MQKIAIWGASSGLGAVLVDYFNQQSFEVIAIARNPQKNSDLAKHNIETITCDATRPELVNEVVRSLSLATVHISTMGSFQSDIPVDYLGHRHLIDALEKVQVDGVEPNQPSVRFVLITSLGCGDSWQYLSAAAKKVFGSAVREKSLAESWLQTSQLDYTILRPAGLTNGDITGTGKLNQNGEIHGTISRQEVARLAAKLLIDPQSIGQVYQCVDVER